MGTGYQNSISLTIGGSLDLVLHPPPPEVQGWMTWTFEDGFTVKVKGTYMAFSLVSQQPCYGKASYTDTAGNEAVPQTVAWTVSDATILTVVADTTDPRLCTVTSVGPAGVAQVTATADVDLGTGVKNIVLIGDITVVAGEAVAGTLVFSSTPPA